MHKWIMFGVFIAACVFGLYLLAFELPEKPVDESEGLPEGMTLLKIEAYNDFTFDQTEYRVKQGESVRLVLKNVSGIHGIEIKELGIRLEGDKLQQDVVFDQPGEYEIACSVACGIGHADMKAKLIVEAA
ncbi:MAG: cytochrome C oxidase subunit II [Thermobacillus sp. ZCTH02-B1]|uniref:cytochrome C oxidase subunit II n=1 Tax=Thermobacillus sp. ZCTH02-B1 TaxID=1858795 RepID=UPI000B565EEF|nr:cytochrome C oxidase subunit II [Thermobacillus sp. ZCTH02-B1]OUM93644.1 MAG: cytochrome C oxidase subunit II [Thermobacillus sp. ZCTH02-B1]